MSEEEEPVLSLQDVLDEDQHLEQTANAVLGDSDDSRCTYSKGYVDRQALYACATCTTKDAEQAGICLACSLHCHEGHELYELYTKRLFRCDCGNSIFTSFSCTLYPEKDSVNSENKYNHNFRGLYCSCRRPYPDAEDDVEDEMIQCCICEDWFHSRHLGGGEVPSSYDEMACDSCMKSHGFLRLYQSCTTPVKVSKESENGTHQDSTTACAEVKLEVTQTEPEKKGNIAGAEQSQPVASDSTREEHSQTDSAKTSSQSTMVCELKRRRAISVSGAEGDVSGAGYFGEQWRSQLCRCDECMDLYKTSSVTFLLQESDSLSAYEKRGASRPNAVDAGMQALESTLDRVQQVEAYHQYNELKSDLSDFLRQFAQEGKVVSKRDIEGFFEGMEARKKRRLNSGEGVPPAQCHF